MIDIKPCSVESVIFPASVPAWQLVRSLRGVPVVAGRLIASDDVDQGHPPVSLIVGAVGKYSALGIRRNSLFHKLLGLFQRFVGRR